MSRGQIIVVAITGLAVLGLLGYEAFALVTKKSPTISAFVWEASYRYPLVPFLTGFVIGLLCGHFFWQRSGEGF